MSLFLDLRKHGKLAEKRNPMYEKSKFGKFWMYFMAVFRTGWLQSVLAVSVCSVFHHHRHQILWNQWCADLLHWYLAADGIQ